MNRDYLTRDMREALRLAVDRRVRALVALPAEHCCTGCGRPHADEGGTEGCGTCWDRMRRRRRRQDPELHAHDLRLWRESAQRRRDAAKRRRSAA